MKVIHLARKPLSESSVAANTLKHGVGALNIEASRITTSDSLGGGAYAENPTPRAGQDMWSADRKPNTQVFQRGKEHAGEFQQPSGRWPANVVLQHLEGCRCVGTRKVRGSAPQGRKGEWKGHGGSLGSEGLSKHAVAATRTDSGGMESVAAWVCEPGCPVADLDTKSIEGGIHGAGHARQKTVTRDHYAVAYHMGDTREMGRFGDKGGASRFYKQVSEDS